MSIFHLSPGVSFNEIDLTATVPAVPTSIGAFAGVFSWGPVDQVHLLEDIQDLQTFFGTPTNYNFETWFTAASFLAYTNALQMVRAANCTSSNLAVGVYNAIANIGTTNVIASTTKNDKDYLNKVGTYDQNVLYIAKYPGVGGNSLRLSVCDSANAYTSTVTVNNAVATGALNILPGQNTGTLVTSTQGSGALSDAVALAIGVTSNLSVGDLLNVGNSTIGLQYVQISSVGLTVNTSLTNTATTINFVDPYRLHTAWANYQIIRYWEFHNVIGVAPGQSQYVLNSGNVAANDLMHIVVADDGGYFSGEPGSVLEVFANVSRATDAVDQQGDSIYYVTAINNSNYLRWTNDRPGAQSNTATNISSSINGQIMDIIMTQGNDGASESNVALSDLLTAYTFFVHKEEIQVGLVMTGKSIGGILGEQVHNWISDNITTIRKDCVVFVSPYQGAVINNFGNEVTSILAFRELLRSSNYSFMDSGYKQIYDQFNNCYRWIPLNGDCAGLAAQTDATNDPWWAFSGFNRGNIKNVVQLAFNPKQADRDQLFPLAVNPVVTFNGFLTPIGTVLYGDKTLQGFTSAFDAINVRRLFITIEKAISIAMQSFLWEFNDSYTQAQVRNLINPYLRIVKGRRGILDFLVVCDATNNTPDVVNQNILICDIYVIPNQVIRNIVLNFVAVPDGVSFSEVLLPPL